MTLERIPLDEQGTEGGIRTIFESSDSPGGPFRHRPGLMRIRRDERQPRSVKLIEADAAKKFRPMVAHCNRRFEVDGCTLQPIDGVILWSPKDVGTKR